MSLCGPFYTDLKWLIIYIILNSEFLGRKATAVWVYDFDEHIFPTPQKKNGSKTQFKIIYFSQPTPHLVCESSSNNSNKKPLFTKDDSS